eukprot:10639638-Karenia_brevis.AAC.1
MELLETSGPNVLHMNASIGVGVDRIRQSYAVVWHVIWDQCRGFFSKNLMLATDKLLSCQRGPYADALCNSNGEILR